MSTYRTADNRISESGGIGYKFTKVCGNPSRQKVSILLVLG